MGTIAFAVALFAIVIAGCRGEDYYAAAQTPPPSDPAKLHSAIDKLDSVYESSYGSKYDALVPNEVAVGAALYRGDAASAVTEIDKERALYKDAAASVKPALMALSRSTVIVNTTDHDAYANFYNAEGDRLNSKAAEYTGFLSLKPSASADEMTAVMNLVADARIKEYVAQKLKTAPPPS